MEGLPDSAGTALVAAAANPPTAAANPPTAAMEVAMAVIEGLDSLRSGLLQELQELRMKVECTELKLDGLVLDRPTEQKCSSCSDFRGDDHAELLV